MNAVQDHSQGNFSGGGQVRKLLHLIPFSAPLIFSFFYEERNLADAISLALVLLIFNIHVYIQSKGAFGQYMRPSAFILNYLLISMILGALGAHFGLIVIPRMHDDMATWGGAFFSIFFVCTCVAFIMIFSDYREHSFLKWQAPPFSFAKILLLLAGIPVGALILAPLAPDWIPVLTAVMYLMLIIQVSSIKYGWIRFVFYLIGILPLLYIHAESKRDAIFLMYPVLIFECQNWKVSIETALKIIFMTLLCLCAILIMTVLRFPSFELSSLVNFIKFLSDYIDDKDFYGYFLLHIEAVYTYFHTMNAIEMVRNGGLPLLYGESYWKFLFVPFRELLSYEPSSAVHHYTSIYDPLYRDFGGSWAVSMLGEGMMNFHFFGAVVCGFLLYMADRFYGVFVMRGPQGNLVSSLVGLYICVLFLNFARGTGFSLSLFYFVIFVLLSIPFYYGFWLKKSLRRI